jgi:tannase/feruloyl esterase
MKICIVSAAIVVSIATRPASAAPASCESLSALRLPDGAITGAQTVAAGAFTPPNASGGGGGGFKTVPAFCRVAATLKPSSDSDIKIEVWLPLSGWNGKFQAVGNGGWAGTISYPAMARAVEHGYATSSTDTGHAGATASFALGHAEKLVDYAYRSEHEMTEKAKAVIAAFYGSAASRSYWNGCSTGGRQALVEARRYPDDFDGIVAGAAANPKTHLDAWRIWMAQAMFKDQASVIPVAKFAVIHKAVVDACDAIDGVKDGLIEDPTKCRFDPRVLQCANGDAPTCLTAAQVAAAQVVMSPVKDRKTGAEIFPGFEPGNELGWARMLSGPDPYATAVDQFKYIVFARPDWNWRTFDLERDVAAADAKGEGTLSAIDPDLSAFARRGGKLLMYHGWSDQDIAPRASINFYKATLGTTRAPSAAAWVRLFMVPGMGHCGGGEGPNTFDMMTALEAWVERGAAPERVVASRAADGKVERTRPLCAYPQVARYSGTGSIDDAASFVCAAR